MFSTNDALLGFPSIVGSIFNRSLFRPKRHTVTFWRFTLSRTVTRGSGRVRSPSEWLSPFLTPFTVLNDMRLRAREGISLPAGSDQRAPPSGLLRAGLSSTSFSRRLRRLKVWPWVKFQPLIFQKSFNVFSVVCFATSSGETPLTSAIFSIIWTIIPLSQRFPRFGSGAI